MSVEIFIPAKATSNRIPRKNTQPVGSQSLVENAVSIAKGVSPQARITVDSDSPQILEQFAGDSRVRPLQRPSHLATNETDGNALMAYAAEHSEADVVVQLLPTAPFISPDTMCKAIAAIDRLHDSAFTVSREKHYSWDQQGPNYDISAIPNSVDMNPTTSETMGLYAIRRTVALELRRRIGLTPQMIEVGPMERLDVNNAEDLRLAQLVANALRAEEQQRFRVLAQFVSSALLLDVAKSTGLGASVTLVKGLKPLLETKTVVGRANTLSLRILHGDEPESGIYRALDTYDFVAPGDILIVDNSDSGAAYFGDINATIALRHGAIAACVLGNTRDIGALGAIGFPVFAFGVTPSDVKGVATFESARTPIVLDGGIIHHGDLVVCDTDGVVIVRQVDESVILTQAMAASAREVDIRRRLAHAQSDIRSLVSRYGEF